ncbi:hypothetical protein SDC9_68505 [bioreactor metagenome]|uniref:Uncharacterized protein n=1 Tax=bioreactor metagenome TaxID=1076179 RepID=A0A644Y0L4_9ZZZZ
MRKQKFVRKHENRPYARDDGAALRDFQESLDNA